MRLHALRRAATSALLESIILVLALVGIAEPGARAQADDLAPAGQLSSNDYINGQNGYHETSYTADFTDPEGGNLTYAWTATGLDCGVFNPSGANSGVWSHPFGYPPGGCEDHGDYEGPGHAGVIEVAVTDQAGNTTRCAITGTGNQQTDCGPNPDDAKDCTINLRLYDGQRGDRPADDAEERRGAVTVFNGNNTDGRGGRDLTQDRVPGEQDLMKLRLLRPRPDRGGVVALTVLQGSGRIAVFDSPTKGRRVPHNPELEIPTSQLPITLWVEGRRPSEAVGDVTLKYTYNPPGPADTCRDVADATIAWAEVDDVRHDAGDEAWPRVMGDPPRDAFERLCGGLGLRPVAPRPRGIRNCIAFRFDVGPARVENLAGVHFDVTRQRASESHIDSVATGAELMREEVKFPRGDEANDDKSDDDESDTPSFAGAMFSFDGPGTPEPRTSPPQAVRGFYDGRFREYVRVRFDGVRPTGNTDSGSVASPKVAWLARHTWISRRDGRLERTTGDAQETGENEVRRP